MKARNEAERDDAVRAYLMADGYAENLPKHSFPMSECSSAMLCRIGEHVNAMLDERERRESKASVDLVYLAALAHFGFDCPHPGHRRLPHHPGYECACCGSFIVPRSTSASPNDVERP